MRGALPVLGEGRRIERPGEEKKAEKSMGLDWFCWFEGDEGGGGMKASGM